MDDADSNWLEGAKGDFLDKASKAKTVGPTTKKVRFKPAKKVKLPSAQQEKISLILSNHGLEGQEDELKEMLGYKRTVGKFLQGRKVSPEDLKKKFVDNMDASNYSSPEAFKKAKERMMKMPAKDFERIFAAIDEDEE